MLFFILDNSIMVFAIIANLYGMHVRWVASCNQYIVERVTFQILELGMDSNIDIHRRSEILIQVFKPNLLIYSFKIKYFHYSDFLSESEIQKLKLYES